MKRSWNLCKWCTANFKGEYFTLLAIVFIVTLLYMMAATHTESRYHYSDFLAPICFFWLSVAVVSPALAFKCIRSKEDRIPYLMLPASNKEKFWVGYIGCVVMAVLGVIVTTILASAVNLGLSYVMPFYDMHPTPFLDALSNASNWKLIHYENTINFTEGILVTVLLYALFFFHHSLFLLGGTIFRKHPLIYTFLTVGAISTVFNLFMSVIFAHTSIFEKFTYPVPGLSNAFVTDFSRGMTPTYLMLILNTLLIVPTVFFYWLAYNRFKKIQVTFGKFMN